MTTLFRWRWFESQPTHLPVFKPKSEPSDREWKRLLWFEVLGPDAWCVQNDDPDYTPHVPHQSFEENGSTLWRPTLSFEESIHYHFRRTSHDQLVLDPDPYCNEESFRSWIDAQTFRIIRFNLAEDIGTDELQVAPSSLLSRQIDRNQQVLRQIERNRHILTLEMFIEDMLNRRRFYETGETLTWIR
jgi:hypothetical protein